MPQSVDTSRRDQLSARIHLYDSVSRGTTFTKIILDLVVLLTTNFNTNIDFFISFSRQIHNAISKLSQKKNENTQQQRVELKKNSNEN